MIQDIGEPKGSLLFWYACFDIQPSFLLKIAEREDFYVEVR